MSARFSRLVISGAQLICPIIRLGGRAHPRSRHVRVVEGGARHTCKDRSTGITEAAQYAEDKKKSSLKTAALRKPNSNHSQYLLNIFLMLAILGAGLF
jgi:hypothetical protein